MKQFLYLDYDVVDSIIAQAEKGIITQMSKETEDGKSASRSIDGGIAGKGDIGASLLKLAKAEAPFSAQGSIENQHSSHSTSKKMIAKTLHDAAFDMAYDYICPRDCDISKNNFGSYVELERIFDFVDLDYLDKLFSKNRLMNFLKKTNIENAKNEATELYGREQSRKLSKQTKSKEFVDASNKKYDGIAESINVFRQLMPYSRMMISSDGYLIPLEDKYFRVSPDSFGFKYGGKIHCVGMITNNIGADTKPYDNQNIFATLRFIINEGLRKILPTSEDNIYVLHPIAVFYTR